MKIAVKYTMNLVKCIHENKTEYLRVCCPECENIKDTREFMKGWVPPEDETEVCKLLDCQRGKVTFEVPFTADRDDILAAFKKEAQLDPDVLVLV